MRHPYADFLHQVQKPARYVGGEYQQIAKRPEDVRISMVLAFPDVYDIGMSHLGTKILYSILNAREDIAAERCFCPWLDMEHELRKRDLPLVSLETARPLHAFDVVGFSLQYELTYTNVLCMLELGGIPLRSVERGEGDPLVIAGGPTATHPEPMAPFIDAFVIGDAEEKLPELLDQWAQMRDGGVPRAERILALARLGGIYCPSLYEREEDPLSALMVVRPSATDGVPYPVRRVVLEDIDRYPFPDDSPEPVAEAIFDRMSVEIARGCTEGCRFCQAGMIYRPVRERHPSTIVGSLTSAVKKGGYDEASLTSLSTADYSCISPLIKEALSRLEAEGESVSLSVSSLRAYGLDEATLDAIATKRAGGLTFAPEAGTQRMRDVINKNVSEQDIIDSAHRIFSRGWQRMKLYFMMGLPTEQDLDLRGIIETGAAVQSIGRRYHGRAAVTTVSVSSFVPKPHTPFQWCAMDTMEELRRKHSALGRAARERRMQVKWHDTRTSWLEGIAARGDVRVADVIEAAYRKGARFDGWDEELQFDAWLEAIAETGLVPERYLGTLRTDAGLPWDHISVGLADGFLAREHRRAVQGRLSPPCGKPAQSIVHHTNATDARADERKLVCYHCGIECDLSAMRADRVALLESLGAIERPEPPVQEPEAPAPRRKGPPPKRDQGESWKYRVLFEKMGVSRLTGHLDLVRMIPRAFRRAGLSMRLTDGYHAKPIMVFGPALPLGTYGLAEVLDVVLLVDVEPRELVERLNAVAPGGIAFTEAQRLAPTDPPVTRLARAAEYLVGLEGVDPSELSAAVAAFLASDVVEIERTRKQRVRRVNIRKPVRELEVVDAAALAALHPELAHAKGPALRLVMELLTEDSFRPQDLATHLCGEREAAPLVARVRLMESTVGGDEEGEGAATPEVSTPAPASAA